MAFLHLTFDNFEFRDLGHSKFVSFKVLAPTFILNHCGHTSELYYNGHTGFNDPHAQNKSLYASFLIFHLKNFTGHTLRSLLYDPTFYFLIEILN